MKILGIFHRFTQHPIHRQILASPAVRFHNQSCNLRQAQLMSTFSEEPELKEFLDFIDNLKNYEKAGVPKGAGTDSDDGFDLGRMRRLMQLLDNPQFKFKVSFSFFSRIFFLLPIIIALLSILSKAHQIYAIISISINCSSTF